VALTVFAFHNHPTAFAVTKADAPIEECPFFLDFSRPLTKLRWLGVHNKWLGFVVGLGVPIFHIGQNRGEYHIGVHRNDPYFQDIISLWRKHFPVKRSPVAPEVDGLDIIADFGRHFPENC
jgi:hypothetical protein